MMNDLKTELHLYQGIRTSVVQKVTWWELRTHRFTLGQGIIVGVRHRSGIVWGGVCSEEPILLFPFLPVLLGVIAKIPALLEAC